MCEPSIMLTLCSLADVKRINWKKRESVLCTHLWKCWCARLNALRLNFILTIYTMYIYILFIVEILLSNIIGYIFSDSVRDFVDVSTKSFLSQWDNCTCYFCFKTVWCQESHRNYCRAFKPLASLAGSILKYLLSQ